MDKKREKRLFNMIYFVLVSIIPLLFVEFEIDGDTYWIIKTGEYISNNSIPAKDFLTMHTNMDLVIQQWLSDVIFYGMYKFFGFLGVILLVYAVLFVFTILMDRLCRLYTDRRIVRMLVLTFSNILMALVFFTTRPQIFTYCIIVIELIVLEKYVKTAKWQYLIVLPFLSILEVNLHASMWTMLFIILLPYIANSLPIKIKGKSISCCKTMPILITAVFMFLGGFINPYGFKGLAFIFTTSIGDKVNGSISELQPLSLTISISDIFYIAVVAIIVLTYILCRSSTQLRFALLTLGTTVMAMLYIKLLAYFIFISYSALLVYLNGVDFKQYTNRIKKVSNKNSQNRDLKVILIPAFCVIVALFFVIVGLQNYEYIEKDYKTDKWIELDSAMKSVENDSQKTGKEIVLFNSFNTGGYLEFYDYKTYIDPRADSFVIEANHDYDYLTEYFEFFHGTKYYKDVINKYDFTYLVFEKGGVLETTLSNDKDYERIFDGETYCVFTVIE